MIPEIDESVLETRAGVCVFVTAIVKLYLESEEEACELTYRVLKLHGSTMELRGIQHTLVLLDEEACSTDKDRLAGLIRLSKKMGQLIENIRSETKKVAEDARDESQAPS